VRAAAGNVGTGNQQHHADQYYHQTEKGGDGTEPEAFQTISPAESQLTLTLLRQAMFSFG
jgi:hypothetical protein